jgi:2-oxo-4-hydroxy-4-carboxy-5-ureidoimidazoline decarboxylase
LADALVTLNRLDPPAARAALGGCCGSRRWAELMEEGRPYDSPEAVIERAERVFDGLERSDWLEAFAAHARIGQPDAGDAQGGTEQAGVSGADAEDLRILAERNAAYEARFGHVFLICATGLDAPATIAALADRYENPPAVELELAGVEQRKISRLRLRGMLGR